MLCAMLEAGHIINFTLSLLDFYWIRDLDFSNQYMVLPLILLDRLVSCTPILHLSSGNMPDNSMFIYIQDKANPFATVLSAAMLLRYGLGEDKIGRAHV